MHAGVIHPRSVTPRRALTAASLSLLALTACPAETVPAGALGFACADDGDCLPGSACRAGLCRPASDGGAVDQGFLDLRREDRDGRDRADAAGAERTADDSARRDVVATDAPAADRPAFDGGLGEAGVDAGGVDRTPAEAGRDAGPTDAALPVDAASEDLAVPVVSALPVDLGAALGSQARAASVFTFVDEQGQAVLLFGPSADGRSALRTRLDGSEARTVAFAFTQDVVGTNKHRNTCRDSADACQRLYPSLGSAECAADTAACGPDNEDGRGLFASGLAKGERWLVAAGARSGGDLDYVYLTPDAHPSPTFRHVDLSAVLGGQTKGASALHVFADDLYLGFPDTGAAKPYLIKLSSMPPPEGLDAIAGNHAVNLHADDMSELRGQQSIDALFSFGDHLYALNAGGCQRSASAATVICGADCAGQWPICTPAAAAHADHAALATSRTDELLPRDRAWIGPAIVDGRVYLGRNTVDGPQLWQCDPNISGAAGACDPGDWTLIAADSEAGATLSRFDDPAVDAISLVAEVEGTLFVGYDSATTGVVLWRATERLPRERYHFAGAGGCNAAAHPASCDGIGGNGLGAPATTTRILDAVAVDDGAAGALVLVVGSATDAPRVVRVR